MRCSNSFRASRCNFCSIGVPFVNAGLRHLGGSRISVKVRLPADLDPGEPLVSLLHVHDQGMEAHKLPIAESLPEIVAAIATYPDAFAAHDLLLSKRLARRLPAELARINADSLSAMTTLAAMVGRKWRTAHPKTRP